MALASPYPDVEIPNLAVPVFVLAAGRERPDAPALIDGLKGDVITHGQLAAYVDRVAANLHARGLRVQVASGEPDASGAGPSSGICWSGWASSPALRASTTPAPGCQRCSAPGVSE